MKEEEIEIGEDIRQFLDSDTLSPIRAHRHNWFDISSDYDDMLDRVRIECQDESCNEIRVLH